MPKITQILTEADYDRTLARMSEIFQAEIGTLEGDERDALFDLIEEYEDEHYPIEGHPVLEIVARAKASIPKHLQPEDVPTDAAKNYKHYLYGWPKESDR